MARRPRWFGPGIFPWQIWPVSWQGWAVTLALLVLGPVAIQLSGAPPAHKQIAWILLAFGYAALLVLTYAKDGD